MLVKCKERVQIEQGEHKNMKISIVDDDQNFPFILQTTLDWNGNMKCHRCGGKMIYEKFYGEEEQFYGWRCIFCGEIVDQVISENRARWEG